MKSLVRKFFYLAIPLILLSCTPGNAKATINNRLCDPPCWLNIQPGTTSVEEAVKSLELSSLVEPKTIKRTKANQYFPPDQIFFKLKGEGSGNLSIENGVVTSIELGEVSLPLKYIFEQYGEPEQVLILPYWEWDKKWYVVFLYPEQGILCEYIKKEPLLRKNVISINQGDIVSTLIYTKPSHFQTTVESIIFGNPADKSFDYNTITQKYKGYGDVKIIRPLGW